jgi:hypothetical protein
VLPGELSQIAQLEMVLRSVLQNALGEKGMSVQLSKRGCSAFKAIDF